MQPGERIAQMIIMPYFAPVIEEVTSLTETHRGAGGFGSTGDKINFQIAAVFTIFRLKLRRCFVILNKYEYRAPQRRAACQSFTRFGRSYPMGSLQSTIMAGLSSLFSLFSTSIKDIGIDLGTANTLGLCAR